MTSLCPFYSSSLTVVTLVNLVLSLLYEVIVQILFLNGQSLSIYVTVVTLDNLVLISFK